MCYVVVCDLRTSRTKRQWLLLVRNLTRKKSLKNPTVLTTDIILWGTKNLFRIDDFLFLLYRKKSPNIRGPPVSHLTSCTPTKSNLYIVNYLATLVSEPDIQAPYIPYTKSHDNFHCLGCPKGLVQDQATFRNQTSFR
jgi:hypothetical protein